MFTLLALTPDVETAGAQAAVEKSPRASDSDNTLAAVDLAGATYSGDMLFSSGGTEWDKGN
jgi:hypothetical protein